MQQQKTKKVDYLIVGQGLAGSILAYFLIGRGQAVHLFDKNHAGSSSKVAAGLMNPITGRRFVKSWMVDEIFPFAIKTYRAIESQFGIQIYQEREIVRALFSKQEENQWDERSSIDSYADFMNSHPEVDMIQSMTKKPFSWGGLKKAGQVDIPVLLETLQKYFLEEDCLSLTGFDYNDLKWDDQKITYQNFEANKIIFCEGHQARFNPWFSDLPFVPSKGEMLEIQLPEHSLKPVVKHHSYLVPIKQERYWVGSTYEWEDLTEAPSEKGRQTLVTALDKMLSTTYTIINQHAAIRPTVKDRRPFIGIHPANSRLCIFNGLGTKGTSLAPFWSNAFCDYLLKGKPISEEVNIARYMK